MTHDSLCLFDDKVYGLHGLCICDEINKARADMLAKCIAAVEALPTSWLGPSLIAALRSLQDQP